MEKGLFMHSRRSILLSLGAGLALPALVGRASAQSKPPEGWMFPAEYEPAVIRLRDQFEPGMLLVDPNTFSLYWTMERKLAMRFYVGVGRGDLYESGSFTVGAKKEWPSWTPTKSMIARNPASYARYADGMPGGPDNPLGARALYLFDERRGDTFLRIHGTPQPWTVGSAVSNGCVRLANPHIEQLYDIVPIGAKVVLYPKKGQA
jgi:lipoprotein-anchoring transpeptidase ErfK/SrfK